ncbi:hypothetical protein CYMTET_53176 [Cymbomonas tetramitiformis]|uniref:Ubiquitin thioesterase OTU n=1 Tax=Cymbomonas tetramitiformis TaxID=36881 RepID=A0AAE0BIN2_9CHLO|nr:hypothetical protein CYMTET_53176 [Cymbomonas tetramitiformis]
MTSDNKLPTKDFRYPSNATAALSVRFPSVKQNSAVGGTSRFIAARVGGGPPTLATAAGTRGSTLAAYSRPGPPAAQPHAGTSARNQYRARVGYVPTAEPNSSGGLRNYKTTWAGPTQPKQSVLATSHPPAATSPRQDVKPCSPDTGARRDFASHTLPTPGKSRSHSVSRPAEKENQPPQEAKRNMPSRPSSSGRQRPGAVMAPSKFGSRPASPGAVVPLPWPPSSQGQERTATAVAEDKRLHPGARSKGSRPGTPSRSPRMTKDETEVPPSRSPGGASIISRFTTRFTSAAPSENNSSEGTPSRRTSQSAAAAVSTAAPTGKLCCDKCDGPHETDLCPIYKKPREDHPDAQKGKGPSMGGDGGNFVLKNARVVRQPGDGSCMFHSLSHGLSNMTSASTLRREIAGFIEKNGDLRIADTPLKDWIKWDSRDSVAAYARRMAVGGWGGGIEMAAFSRLKNRVSARRSHANGTTSASHRSDPDDAEVGGGGGGGPRVPFCSTVGCGIPLYGIGMGALSVLALCGLILCLTFVGAYVQK